MAESNDLGHKENFEGKVEEPEYDNCENEKTKIAPDMPSQTSPKNVKGAVVRDADGNYYYQSSGKLIKVEPYLPKSNKKNPAPAKLMSKLESNIKEQKNEKNQDDTIASETGNLKKVYEFDENQEDPDDPNGAAVDYGSKGIMKNLKKNKTQDVLSFVCEVCSYQTFKKSALSRHLKSHCDERPYICDICERGFKTKTTLMNHRNTHMDYKPHACSSCDMAFNTAGDLKRHERYRHTHIKPHKCTECDYRSVELSKLRRHMRCHTGERPYQCPHCTYASPDTFKLKRHMRTHTGEKPYECSICHARFTQSNSLKQHRRIHSVNEKEIFQCHLCPTTCGRKTDLRLHIKNLHSPGKPMICKRCGKELPDRYSYKMHIKTHEGEKCYRCEHCSYASISQRHLDSHILVHFDAKPFVCQICKCCFRQKQLLVRHERIYHSDNYEPKQLKKEHKCPHCNRMFAFNGNLIRHMEIHDPTSRIFEEREKLKVGRMTRINLNDTVVTSTNSSNLQELSGANEEKFYEETEEEEVDGEEFLAEYEEAEEDEEEYDVDNIQYIYDEYEGDEHEEDNQVKYEQQQEIMQSMDTVQTSSNKSVKSEDRTVSEVIVLEENDNDEEFMVIEVLSGDAEDEEQPQQEENIHEVQQEEFTSSLIEKEATSSTVKRPNKKHSLISDYFGFEVNSEDDNEEIEGAIKILQMIEQE